jgi:hypothetical protein
MAQARYLIIVAPYGVTVNPALGGGIMLTFASDNSKAVADWFRTQAEAIETGPQAIMTVPDKPETKIAPLIPLGRLQHPADLPATHLKSEVVETQGVPVDLAGLPFTGQRPSLAIVPGVGLGSQSAQQLVQLSPPLMIAVEPVTDEDLSLYSD